MKKSNKNEKGQFIEGMPATEEVKAKIAQSMQGNLNALKLKTTEARQAAYLAYCEWIAAGRGKQGWYYDFINEKDEVDCITWQTLESYLDKYPAEFNPIQKIRAENHAYQQWETVGIDMMLGKHEKPQPALYQMMMRNKFGWDKESKNSVTFEADARKFLKFCENENDDK